MYQNAGRSIKSVVSIVVKIGYALSVIGGVGIVLLGLVSGDIGTFIASLLGTVIVAGLGCLSTWLSGLWLYAYGEITDRLISIDERLYHANLDGGAAAQPAAPATPVAPPPAAPTAAAPVAPVASAAPAAPKSDVRYCSACGARNRADANYCVACSKRLS